MMRAPKAVRVVSPRDQRAIRTGLLVLAPALCYNLLLKPYLSAMRRALDNLQSQAALLDREEELTASLPAIRAQVVAAAEAARRTMTRTYLGADSAAAMSAFRRDVVAALKAAGLVVQRVEMRDSTSRRDALQELTVDVRAQGDFESILTGLTRLEANGQLLRVSHIAVDKTGERHPTGTELLSFFAVIHGYAQ